MKQLRGHVVVIGAGVIGLQTAVFLLESGFLVTIIAKHLPEDVSIEYTSPWAGAQWRTHASADDREQQMWDIETYQYWLDLMEHEKPGIDPSQTSGLSLIKCLFYWVTPTREITDGPSSVWFASRVRNFSVVPSSELLPGVHAGVSYDSIAINVPHYLRYLQSRVLNLGGKFLKIPLPTEKGLKGALTAAEEIIASTYSDTERNHQGPLGDKILAFVNASGLLAHKLVPDPDVYPVRGQTLVVRGTASEMRTVENSSPENQYISYVIPRIGSDSTVIGGTKVPGDWNDSVDSNITKDIKERCKLLAPELLTGPDGDFDVLKAQVGLRPGRKGGARVELEEVETGSREAVVIHQYGHAGAGYQNSVGSARKTIRLLEEYLASRKEA